jgi:Asp-tRNA(Asn)/Glu-tRNA(Gln) amidotransferase A subunit family amidase
MQILIVLLKLISISMSEGGTTWLSRFRDVKEDAECVSRLRSTGVLFVGKANMNELGLGVQGQNVHYGYESQ